MKTTSDGFKALAEDEYGVKYYHKITLNGTEITEDINDFKYSHTCNGEDTLTIGNVGSAMIKFSINRPSINLANEEIEVFEGIDVSGTIEYVKLGIFKVLKPINDRGNTTYQCVDRMTYLMNMPFFSELTDNVTDVAILNEICTQVGITLANTDLISHTLPSAPIGYTRREVISYMSQLQGKNAIINNEGNLELIWYSQTDYVVDDDKIYYEGTDSINGEMDYTLEYIECVVRKEDEEVNLKSGNGIVGMSFENPFMTQEILDEVFVKIGGFTYRPVEVQFLGDFRLEVGDIVTVTTNNSSYIVPIMELTHDSDGGVKTTIQSIAETESENGLDLSSPSTKAMDRYYANLVLINKALVNKLDVDQLDAVAAEIQRLVVNEIDGKYAEIDFANIDTAKVDKNIVSLLLAEVGLIDRATIVEGHVTKILDAVEINANSIKSGTLVTDRLLLSGKEGSILYELNNLGELTSTNVNSLDGYVLTDRTITADKIIAKSITTNELDVKQIFGNTAVLNTIVSQDIFADAIATHTMVVGAYEYAEEAVNLSKPTNEAQGSPILLTDSADGTAIEFGAYGRSEQNGEPTPDNPIDIKSVGESGTLEVKSVGKNLFNSDTVVKDSYIDDNTGAIIAYSNSHASDYILVKPNEKYFIHTITESGGHWGAWYDKNKKFISGILGYNLAHTAPSNAKYMRLTVNRTGNNPNFADNFQVERGDKFTGFEPHKESSVYIPLTEPLRSSLDGTVKDEIACVDGVYGVIRRFKEVVFDGSSDEGWSNVSGNAPFAITLNNLKETESHNMPPNLICTHYEPVGRTDTWVNYDYLVSYSDNGLIRFRNVDVSTLDEWKTNLQSNPITVQYELAEPVFEPFEDQTPFSNIATYNHITHISATDNPEMRVEYYRNNKNGEQFSNFVDVSKRTEEMATNANNTANAIKNNIYVTNTTLIDGGKIYTGSITAKQIDVKDLFAQDIVAEGSIRGAKIIGSAIQGSTFYFEYKEADVDYITWLHEGGLRISRNEYNSEYDSVLSERVEIDNEGLVIRTVDDEDESNYNIKHIRLLKDIAIFEVPVIIRDTLTVTGATTLKQLTVDSINNYVLGNACAKNSIAEVKENSTDLVTSGAVYSKIASLDIIRDLSGAKVYIEEMNAGTTMAISNTTSSRIIYVQLRALITLQIGNVVNVYSVYNHSGSGFQVAPVVLNQSSNHGTVFVNSSGQLCISNGNANNVLRVFVVYV